MPRLPLLLVAALAVFLVAPRAGAFGYDDVAARARSLAAAPYRKPESTLPKEVQGTSTSARTRGRKPREGQQRSIGCRNR